MKEPQHDVTLVNRESVQGKPFPCPLCGMALPVALSQKQKPYCVCNFCGIQIFFRGKAGIRRLQQLLKSKRPMRDEIPAATIALSLYNRLEDLKRQREGLEQKQGIIFRDSNLDQAIGAIDGEIHTTELELKRARKQAEGKK